MSSPALIWSNEIAIGEASLHRTNGLAATRADHVAMLVEEDVVVDHEQPFALDELVERACLQRDHVSGASVDIVAPGLAGIDRARAAHPVVRRRAGEHQQ